MNLMRQIDNEVKSQWDQIKCKKNIEFVDDCPPSMLKGWTDDNPSLWEIDHPDKPNREDILLALCRRKQNWDKITYLLFDNIVIDKAGLSITQTNGNTGDSKIDISKTHYEIKGVSAKNLCTLIYHIMLSQFEIGSYKKTDFDKILLSAYDNSHIFVPPKTDTMSIPQKSIAATTDTLPEDIVNEEENISKSFSPISSESNDSITGESSSITT